MQFSEIGLLPALMSAVSEAGYTQATPIQARAIPAVLAGRDVLGCAQTGTGKTAAFSLPLLQVLASTPRDGRIRGLVLTPTRELALQIGECIREYGRHLDMRHATVFGGVSQYGQERALRARPDVLVATPGRLLDLMRQGILDLTGVTMLVLDEADRMLDMGFIHDIRQVLAVVPEKRQTLLFSATMPSEIHRLGSTMLRDPVRVEVTPVASTAPRIDQSVYFVDQTNKRALLQDVLRGESAERVVVFTRTKHGADRIARNLAAQDIRAVAIHGDKAQGQRERSLRGFRNGVTRVLVATDIAARGLDIDGVSHVINYDVPNDAESYVHRIGRTARAGASGVAISFCSGDEHGHLASIERLIGQRIRVVSDHPYHEQPPQRTFTHGPRRPHARGGFRSDRPRSESHARQNERSAPLPPRAREWGDDVSRNLAEPSERSTPNRTAPRTHDPRRDVPLPHAQQGHADGPHGHAPRAGEPRTYAPRSEVARAYAPRSAEAPRARSAEAPRPPRSEAPRTHSRPSDGGPSLLARSPNAVPTDDHKTPERRVRFR